MLLTVLTGTGNVLQRRMQTGVRLLMMQIVLIDQLLLSGQLILVRLLV